MLRSDNQRRIREHRKILVIPDRGHSPAKRESQLLCTATGMVIDLKRGVTTKQGDGTLFRTKTFLYVQRLPRTLLLGLANTERELGRMAQGCFANLLGLCTPNVENDQAQRAPDGGIRPKPMAQSVMPAIHPNGMAYGTVNNRQWGCREGGDVNSVGRKLFFTQGFHRSNDHRKI